MDCLAWIKVEEVQLGVTRLQRQRDRPVATCQLRLDSRSTLLEIDSGEQAL